jgi:hypothetical protein
MGFSLLAFADFTQAVTLPFYDGFNGSKCTDWKITNESVSTYNFTENPGSLRIYTTPTDIWGAPESGSVGTNNLINLFNIPVGQDIVGSFTVTTKIAFPVSPFSHPQQAGIILLGNSAGQPDIDNYIRLTFGYIDGYTRLQRTYETGGNPNDGAVWGTYLSIGVDPIWLRIVKSNNRYDALFSLDGTNFDLFNSFITSFSPAYIGLGAFHTLPSNQSIPVDFDYFDITGPNNSVPEPSTIFLLGAGLIGLAAYARNKFGK